MALAAFLAGCASSDNNQGVVSNASFTPPSAASSLAAGDYRIGPLDILDISVFQVPDLTKTVQVSSGGQISLPLIGAVSAAGKTVAELEADLAARLGAQYLQSPQVSVYVKEYTSQRVTVEGAVNKPGIYPMTGQATLMQVIAVSGGLDRVADPRGIIIFRNIDGKRKAAAFDLPAIRAGKAEDPRVYGGDVVVVDQSGTKTALRGLRESLGIFGIFTPLL